ncbi:peptidase domain-containing ABC transporter [Pedobacter zeae]|uniref:ATP-binding cassette subfamily B protein n=1 Tax=Pedobacter zeae TaxID=1737356 RepID=A0A7W6K7R2_9SPHI|nr:peptidase domain-containing ABC transporter [Pedobacter zeae]MBB4106751.1 ATP-binding cassette subfamily B protein [Pedobacter zeae]
MTWIDSFPFYKQADFKDCGPTCLKIISKFYGKIINIQLLRVLSETTRNGSNLKNLSHAAENIGFRSLSVKISFEKLKTAPLPCIVHWDGTHFVVLYKIEKNHCFVADPAHGKLKYEKSEFISRWIGLNSNEQTPEGICLLLETTPKFFQDDDEQGAENYGFSFIFRYLTQYKSFIANVLIGLLAGSVIQLIFPFLTQSIVDIGIKYQDINFVYLMLFAQLFLFLGRTSIEIFRSWILLHLSTRINISLLSDFFIKLMSLPISFFDVRMTGDMLQRINDHNRVEKLLTTSSLSVLFSIISLIVFGVVLAVYNKYVFVIFIIGSIMYFAWILFFFKKRRDLDYKKFSQVSQEQSKVIELINGMQEIKLHNAEKQKRWNWEYLRARLFKISMKTLALEQYQLVGSSFINELKNILITVLSAKLVIEGEITLGMMLAITYIVGQLNSPIAQIITFLRELQDAKISIERISEIHLKKDELSTELDSVTSIPVEEPIRIENLSFRYIGSSRQVLTDLNLVLPQNKVTAIVGASGSGKSTLMKLLLKFYQSEHGKISLGDVSFNNISQQTWRANCGVVMQEGYIFNDSIANNVALGADYVDKEKLKKALEVANIKEFVETLPLSFNTKIGMEGVGLSTGQKQRILIARAVYKDPKFLFFDEATSALDANNEKKIMQNLNSFFENKTVIVIAHRLSTVKNAHQIIVLNEGRSIEVGTHDELVKAKGGYFELVRNQLELGE